MTSAILRPPEAAGLGRGMTLALIAHGLLILALSYGLNWHSDSSPAFEAELWSAVPQVAAPREEAPPEPEPQAPKPDTRAQQRAAEEAAAEQREAEIAIAKEKKRKEEMARDEAAKLEREKAAKEKLAKDKVAKEKADKEEQDRKKAKDAKEAKDTKEADARREALRKENLRRMQGMIEGTPGSTGNAAQNAAPSAGYAGRIKGKIRPLIIYPDDGTANPTAEIQVTLGPDGRILGSKVLKASPDADWDRAVLRAIEKAETLPRDVDGRVPPVLIQTFRPRE